MKEIEDAVAKVEGELAGVKNDLTLIKTGITGLNNQVQTLNDKLSAGATLSDEDNTALAQLASDAATLQTQADNVAAAFAPPPPAADPAPVA